jgi:2-keto-4-pentenoate hydratase/2-oxohepta-3-ene-1,7-dioic acid hydratase in catechol pathway
MRILRFYSADGSVHLGVRGHDDVVDLGQKSPIDLMRGALLPDGPRLKSAGLRLDAPIRDARKLFALAGNYRKHIVESGFKDPTAEGVLTPQVFWKPPTSINSPGGTIPIRSNNVFVDWEIELAVIIGKRAKDVPANASMDCVFGYTIINDISERKFNARVENRKVREFDPFFDWLIGKWFDGHAPLGPEIVTKDEIADPHNLNIRLAVNGVLMQESNTSYMIFDIPQTIAYISGVVTLEPGDIIAMGTPEGVGFARGIALKPGDHLRGEIEGIGVLENTLVAEAAQ